MQHCLDGGRLLPVCHCSPACSVLGSGQVSEAELAAKRVKLAGVLMTQPMSWYRAADDGGVIAAAATLTALVYVGTRRSCCRPGSPMSEWCLRASAL